MSSFDLLNFLVDEEVLQDIERDAATRRVRRALGASDFLLDKPSEDTTMATAALELQLNELLSAEPAPEQLGKRRALALRLFQIVRASEPPTSPDEAADWLLKVGAFGVLADRSADVQALLRARPLPALRTESSQWDERVWATVRRLWLLLLRKSGWADLDQVHQLVAKLRADQAQYEPALLVPLEAGSPREALQAGWELMASYHLAKVAELLGEFLTSGSADRKFDVRPQLQMHFDSAARTMERSGHLDRLDLVRLLERTADDLIRNSIWTVTRAVNSRVTKFVEHLTAKGREAPIYEMLPPQRHALREQGLLGSARRAVVVSLPTSSGKTYIAQFRILQALNQFDSVGGWVAYLCPTRALVNQITRRLQRDFGPLGVVVEKASPALEEDDLEAAMLVEAHPQAQFRVLVTTPEKLDLMIRGKVEAKVGRPLTLVVVDEAHGIASEGRGIKLELMLATINRECRDSQFLLLTPFVPNAEELAKWLDPDSGSDISFGVEWQPNDRIIALARPRNSSGTSQPSIVLQPLFAGRPSLPVLDEIELPGLSPLGFSAAALKSPGKLAASTAVALSKRGTVLILAKDKPTAWATADFVLQGMEKSEADVDRLHAERYLEEELGSDHPLIELIRNGVAVHHAGLSEDARALVEWLTEKEAIRVLVATTTLAQGVNFPVSAVVFASPYLYAGPGRGTQLMSAEEFWNIAGRAARVGQREIGVVAIAAGTDERAAEVTEFVRRQVESLSSTLVAMVQQAMDSKGELPELQVLSPRPAWSSFLQYLVHSYRFIDDHDQFVALVEQVLRGTLGFQELRRTDRGASDNLVLRVRTYADRLRSNRGQLSMVDATGFSLETVTRTFQRLSEADIDRRVWTPELFGVDVKPLARVMGVLLQVPELRSELEAVSGGDSPDGKTLALIVRDWVCGRSLVEMSQQYFANAVDDDEDTEQSAANDRAKAMTRCCSLVFGKLTNSASWGVAALQTLTLGDDLKDRPEEVRRMVRNLPARIYYGVNTDAAISLRTLGVPRTAAVPLAARLGVTGGEPLHLVRQRLRGADSTVWQDALGGSVGESFHRVWRILDGG